ncbi:hypothetical protein PMAYCL1PPCAC_01621, partial [Pristionchus mayeri]
MTRQSISSLTTWGTTVVQGMSVKEGNAKEANIAIPEAAKIPDKVEKIKGPMKEREKEMKRDRYKDREREKDHRRDRERDRDHRRDGRKSKGGRKSKNGKRKSRKGKDRKRRSKKSR